MDRNLRMDAVDALLVLGGFFLLVTIGVVLQSVFALGMPQPVLKAFAVAMLTLPLVRRRVFGPPPMRSMKTGVLWPLVSMAALFLMLAAFAAVGLAGVGVVHLTEDVRADLALFGPRHVEAIRAGTIKGIFGALGVGLLLGTVAAAGINARYQRSDADVSK